jgi:hypothetical protein
MKRSSGVLGHDALLLFPLPVPLPVPVYSAFLVLALLCSRGRFRGGWPDALAAADWGTTMGWQSLLRRADGG